MSKIDKIQFESNSQHYVKPNKINYAVSKIDKIQFESNSQRLTMGYNRQKAVSKIDKIQFESNSQLIGWDKKSNPVNAVSKIDKIQFESNSQHLATHALPGTNELCQRSIKYNLKAIHNCKRVFGLPITECCVKDR